MNRSRKRNFSASVAVTLIAVSLGMFSGSAAQADPLEPNYTCGPVIESLILGNPVWMTSRCTGGPAGLFNRGTINGNAACNIYANAQPDGTVSILARPGYPPYDRYYCR